MRRIQDGSAHGTHGAHRSRAKVRPMSGERPRPYYLGDHGSVPLADRGERPTLPAMATQPLSKAKITAALESLPAWKFNRDALAKTFIFADFREAMSFMMRVGFEAEAMNHHPEWTN